MNKKQLQHISIDMDPDLPLHVFHGVIGGPNQAGDIEMNFFTESEDLPGPSEVCLTEDGRILNETSLEEQRYARRITRTVYARAVMAPETARALALWLMTQLDRVDGPGPLDDNIQSITLQEPPSNSRQ